ncbi:uncharacterized protein ACA1_122770, partial [Acanthamoeba castellanii str. Neff]
MSTGGTSPMVTGLTMALKAVCPLALFLLVASHSTPTLVSPPPHSKRSSSTC